MSNWINDFPYHDVIKKVIVELRGEESYASWSGQRKRLWGSHWYISLGAMMKECQNEQDAEEKLRRLFWFSDNDEQELNRVFNKYRDIAEGK